MTRIAMTRIGSTEELRTAGRLVGKVGDLPVLVVWDEGRAYAIEDRCPHLGFPLHRGTVECGMITCHWHHARFDLASGSTLDPWADDATGFDVRLDGDDVVVTRRSGPPALEQAERRLREGMEQGLGIVIAKAVLALVEAPDGSARAIRVGAEFGSRNRAPGWGSGMTVLACIAGVLEHLAPSERAAALVHALVFCSRDVRGHPVRFAVPPLDPGQTPERLAGWYRRFVETREQDGAARAVATLAAAGDVATLERTMGAAATDHVYLDTGHTLDFTNKAFELLGRDGAPDAEVLVSLVAQTCEAERAEETSEWNHPDDLAALVRDGEPRLLAALASADGRGAARPGAPDVRALAEGLLDATPAEVVESVVDAARAGASAEELARAVALAAALRLVRFATSNDPGDWDTVHHTFTFANAVHQFAVRSRAPEAARGILHAALRVHLDRFLNVPAARPPRATAGTWEGLARCWDVQGQVDEAANEVVGLLRSGATRAAVVAALGRAVLAEDAGFHVIQGYEAAVRQALAWPEGSEEVALVLAGYARFLAAQTPTRRELSTIIRTAVRLRRGGSVFDEDPTAA